MNAGPRLYQLTYTVAEGGKLEAGGWQVKQASVGLPSDHGTLMRRAVSVDISSPTPLPANPTPGQLAARPVRFTYRSTKLGGLLCRAVPAGLDVTGRGGNVFNHVRLDPALSSTNQDPELTRPVDWWPAGGWLAPFGARAVQEAVFDDGNPPVAEPEVCRSFLLDFLFADAPGRWELLGPWLDGVRAVMMRSFRTVVLALPDPADAVWWIAAANHLTSARLCRMLSFSTFERRAGLVRDADPPALVVIPAEDLPSQPGEVPGGQLVLDGSVPPRRAGSERWRTSLGQEYEMTAWSQVVRDLPGMGRELVDELLSTSDEEDLAGGGAGEEGQRGRDLALFLRRGRNPQDAVPPPGARPSPEAAGATDSGAAAAVSGAEAGAGAGPVDGSTRDAAPVADQGPPLVRTTGDQGGESRGQTAAESVSDEDIGFLMSEPSPRIPVTTDSTGLGGAVSPWDRVRRTLQALTTDAYPARGQSGPPGTERDQVPGAEGLRALLGGLPDDPEQHAVVDELAEHASTQLRTLRGSADSTRIHADARASASLCLMGAADLGHRLRLVLWGRYGVPERRVLPRSSRHHGLDAEVDRAAAQAVALLREAGEAECGAGLLVGPWGERLHRVGERLDERFVRGVLWPKLLGGPPGPGQQPVADVGADPVQIVVAGQLAYRSGAAGPDASTSLRWLPHLRGPRAGGDTIMESLLVNHPEASLRWLRRLWWVLWGTAGRPDTAAAQEQVRWGLDVVRRVMTSPPAGVRPLLAAFWDRIALVGNCLARSQLAVEFANRALAEAARGAREDPEVSIELRLMDAVLGVWAREPRPLLKANQVPEVGDHLAARPLLARGYAPYLALTALYRCDTWPLEGQLSDRARGIWEPLAGGLSTAGCASLRQDLLAWTAIVRSTEAPLEQLACCGDRGTHVWHLCLQAAGLGQIPRANPFLVRPEQGTKAETLAAIALEAFLSNGNTFGENTKHLKHCLCKHRGGLSSQELQWAVEFLPEGARRLVWNDYRSGETTVVPVGRSGKDA